MKSKQINDIVSFIRKCVLGSGLDNAVIGISGGIDSAVVAALAVNALGRYNVRGILMPYGKQSDIQDSYDVVKKLGITIEEIDITHMVDSFQELENEERIEIEHIRYGNIKARVRMICLYDRAKKYNGLVLGTGNKSELLMGYFTLHGDGACDLEPIGHLYKTEVFELAKELKVPKHIIEKAPSAGLWDGQTDEEEMGYTYKEMDSIFMKAEGMSWKVNLPKMMVKE